MSRVPAAMWKRVKERDGAAYCCDASEELWVPQHRQGRGMGGCKTAHTYPNIIVFCSFCNGLAESNPAWAAHYRDMGWKVPRNSMDTPDMIPVTDRDRRRWWLLSDGTRVAVDGAA
ncbi:hypothetical protein LWF01_02790 [Saxibacter everestensis]|uniref:HNH endonuclease n=1 Tax=Saxibacter everestensis TaxID=2909229 RepID=A0ABY8QWG7_9MICO|nr:hypothetical protein LWF01_02790 [Brevibacteriaceae bacterium ZFBP1038]